MNFKPTIFAVQAVSFGCELAALFFLARWGWRLDTALWLRGLAAATALLLAATAWGIWAAPRSATRLSDPARLGFELLFYGAAMLALLGQGHTRTAAVFGAVVAAQLVASFALRLRGS
ncbi:YrdB family protein [Deinococcus alpinitundrae]|uniref:YrdB family protein n=1 Tax=Deinococcus alpinitundrae TaxID=468913 RepID=UPI00137A5879|nr:YrdB family protein [Deinococcus alpinitundrae]